MHKHRKALALMFIIFISVSVVFISIAVNVENAIIIVYFARVKHRLWNIESNVCTTVHCSTTLAYNIAKYNGI